MPRLQVSVCRSHRRREAAAQSGSSARAQCPQWLMPMQLTCKVSRCASMDGSECNGPELEADNGGLAANAADAVGQWHWKDVELELPHGRVLDTPKMVEVVLRGSMEQD